MTRRTKIACMILLCVGSGVVQNRVVEGYPGTERQCTSTGATVRDNFDPLFDYGWYCHFAATSGQTSCQDNAFKIAKCQEVCASCNGTYVTVGQCIYGPSHCNDATSAWYGCTSPNSCANYFTLECACNYQPPSCPDYCDGQCPHPENPEQTDCQVTGSTDYCAYPSGCPNGENIYGNCCFIYGTPILLDVAGTGFDLTDLSGGVPFAIGPTSIKRRVSWTTPGGSNAWLAYDRNGNGIIDNGTELFGNFTDQPEPPRGQERNGFLALAQLDRASHGGDESGAIDAGDRVFRSLLLWADRNHDGVSQANELSSLSQAKVTAIRLGYHLSKRRDEFGNSFRYRAKVETVGQSSVEKWAWDVFLLVGPNR